jgi:hypothetical protein
MLKSSMRKQRSEAGEFAPKRKFACALLQSI